MRVHDDVTLAVAFLCVKAGERYRYGGTAAFVTFRYEDSPKHCEIYLVTARHCVESALMEYGNLYVRFNTNEGGVAYVAIDTGWVFPEDPAVDVAARSLFEVPMGRYDFRYWGMPENCCDHGTLAEEAVGIGDELLVSGLFTRHFGTKRNLPIVRSGIIAAMPDEALEDPKTGLPYRAYLAEVRSIGGLSGSPVFAILPEGRVRYFEDGNGYHIRNSRRILLLGLIRGHWDHRSASAAVDYQDEELHQVNMGIAIVTPIQEVLDLMITDELVRDRRAKVKRIDAALK